MTARRFAETIKMTIMATSRSQLVFVEVCVACSKEYVVAILCGCKDSMNSENAFEFYDFKYLKKKLFKCFS